MSARPKIEPISVPSIPLSCASAIEYFRSLQLRPDVPFWWYMGTYEKKNNLSTPFEDRFGNWWYQLKKGFCWPADFLTPIESTKANPPLLKSFFGFQHILPDDTQCNSRLVINIIRDLSNYSLQSIDDKRRNAIRKGSRFCELHILESYNSELSQGCLDAWNQLSLRTGWKKPLKMQVFTESWRRLLDLPATTIIVGLDKESGRVAGFLITKAFGDTAYVDTIASHSDLLKLNVNDILMYTFLVNAQLLPAIKKVHYAIVSNINSLEKFKQSLGFEKYPYPARTCLRPCVGLAMRFLFRSKYRRMTGKFMEDKAEKNHTNG